MKWKGKVAIALVGMGVTCAVAMPFLRSEAAIAVVDQKNIEQAIETAIKTANILTEEQKQYLLKVLDMKKLDFEELYKFSEQNAKQQQEFWDEKYQIKGVGTSTSTVETVWNDRMGNIDAILNGQITVYDAYTMEQQRQKLLHDTYLDAARAAKDSQNATQEILMDTQSTMEALSNAEGTVQALQANGNLSAQQIYLLAKSLGLTRHLVITETTDLQKKAIEEAEREAKRKAQADESAAWVEAAN